jgi:hypothetical protein
MIVRVSLRNEFSIEVSGGNDGGGHGAPPPYNCDKR